MTEQHPEHVPASLLGNILGAVEKAFAHHLSKDDVVLTPSRAHTALSEASSPELAFSREAVQAEQAFDDGARHLAEGDLAKAQSAAMRAFEHLRRAQAMQGLSHA